jgi:hypothetical protein
LLKIKSEKLQSRCVIWRTQEKYKVPYQGYEIDVLINFSTPVVRSEKSKLGKRCRKNGRLLRWENVPEILHNRQQNEI